LLFLEKLIDLLGGYLPTAELQLVQVQYGQRFLHLPELP